MVLLARRYRQTPVFYEPAPARWPWALALVVAIGAVVFAAVMRPGIVPLGGLSELLPQRNAAPQVVPSPNPEVAANATPPFESVPTETSAAEVASPAPIVATESADEVAADWVARWNDGDYAGMYALTSGTVRRTIPLEEFVSRYQGIVDRAELQPVRAEITGTAADTSRVPFRATFESGIAGEFSEENSLPLVHEVDGWRVAWTPSTIFAELGTDGCVDVDRLPSERGKILDRHGEPLAYDGQVERVGIVPGLIPAEDEQRVLRELSDLTKMDEAAIKARYEGADPSWFIPIMDFPREESEHLLDVISRLPGVSVKAEIARVYPLGEQAAHITGYVTEPTAEQLQADPTLVPGQRIGQAGVEAGADDILAGVPGGRLLVVHCDSRVEQSEIASREPVPPRDVVLTIDRAFQTEVFNEMKAQ